MAEALGLGRLAHPVEDLPLLGLGRVADLAASSGSGRPAPREAGRSPPARWGSASPGRGTGPAAATVSSPIVTCRSCIASRRARLDLRGGAVDLVGEDDVGEDGPSPGDELLGLRVEDQRADEVGREQVGRELDPGEGGVEPAGERPDGEGLREAGNSFEQDVPVGEEADRRGAPRGRSGQR